MASGPRLVMSEVPDFKVDPVDLFGAKIPSRLSTGGPNTTALIYGATHPIIRYIATEVLLFRARTFKLEEERRSAEQQVQMNEYVANQELKLATQVEAALSAQGVGVEDKPIHFIAHRLRVLLKEQEFVEGIVLNEVENAQSLGRSFSWVKGELEARAASYEKTDTFIAEAFRCFAREYGARAIKQAATVGPAV